MCRMIDPGPEATERRTQLLRGVLDMSMLALLDQAPAHGYELVRRLNAAGFHTVGYGTVYPLLTRMRRLGLVTNELHASPTGPDRKVYGLTEAGHQALAGWTEQWTQFVEMINTTLAPATPPSSSSGG